MVSERTELPRRLTGEELRALARVMQQRRDAGEETITLPLDVALSLATDAALYQTHHDARLRRQRDGARTARRVPPKLTLDNLDEHDDPR